MKNSSQTIQISPAPIELNKEFNVIFTSEALQFLIELLNQFQDRVEELHLCRAKRRKLISQKGPEVLKFKNCPKASKTNWKIAPIPARLVDRKVDLGDVSPSNTEHFVAALNTNVQGIQVDFDDGHCPTWTNQIQGFHNVYKFIHNQFSDVPNIKKAPVLMLRPRAWNMWEHNMKLNGKSLPGPLVDFVMLMFHNAHILIEAESGPYFYLSKLEGSEEAKLWNDIFIWAQKKLNIPQGTIKACVLIENIVSTFEMNEILYELREHSIGLNCGVWDYAASFISKFGGNPKYIFPDRSKYVHMGQTFLQRYQQLVIRTCHARGAPATGGMTAVLLTRRNQNNMDSFGYIKKAMHSKYADILEGVDGFLVYEIKLVPYMNELWKNHLGNKPNQINKNLLKINITESELLLIPKGKVTSAGLKYNVQVAIMFIFNWLEGRGHFPLHTAVEDSATAEISRSQIWQWIKHKTLIDETKEIVTIELVGKIADTFTDNFCKNQPFKPTQRKMFDATRMFMIIVTAKEFPEFITSYLNDSDLFKNYHNPIVKTKL